MSTQALLLVMSAALLHAIWNLIFKKTNGGLPFVWLVSLASAVIYLPFVILQLAQCQASLTGVIYGFALVVPAEAGNAFPTDKALKHEAVDSKRTAAA